MNALHAASTATITPRDIAFDVDPTRAADWAGGDETRTTLFNALSLLFPQGERFFISAVAAYRDQVVDPQLAAEVRAFSAQEGLHTREHLAYNEILESVVDVAAVDDMIAKRIAFLKKMTPPLVHLGITCALEHFTAIMAHELLSRDEYLAGAEPSYRRLWTWHAIEECEHKSVAFDVFRTVTHGKSEWLRRRLMVTVTFNFLLDIVLNCHAIFKHAGRHRSPRAWAKLAWFCFGKPGFLRRLIPAYVQYYRRDFHPSQIDDRSQREAGLQTLSPAY